MKIKEDNEYCVWKRTYVYFKFMGMFNSVPSIMNENTVNMNLRFYIKAQLVFIENIALQNTCMLIVAVKIYRVIMKHAFGAFFLIKQK